tara:strand:+ start:1977 stop:2189 length:213 start_codon:yes stop_codon:yes gene_type:complete
LPKKQLKKIVEVSGIGLQLSTTVFLGAYVGNYLDDTYPISQKRIYTLLFTLLATGIAIYNVIRQLNRNND